MITIKRQIENEKERFGSFAETDSYVDNTTTEREVNDDLLLMRSYTNSTTEIPVSAPTPAIEEKVGNVVRPAPVEEERRTETPVRRNSNARMHDIIHYEQPAEEVQPEVKPVTREKKLTASAKKAIAIYMSVVIAVVIAVIITGVCISGVNSDIANLETTIQQQEEVILQQNAELGALEDVNAIENKAESMGMVKIKDGETVGYDELEVGENTEDKNGAFDSVRDWLNTVFGG